MSRKNKHVDFQQTANGGVAVSGKEESPQQERKMNVILDEISVTGSNIYGSGTFTTYNPDDLVGKKGLEIYKKMRIDDQIKAVLTMKKMAMLSTGWDVHSASQDVEDIEKRDFIKWNLDNLVGTLEDHLYNIFTGYDFGFSLSELVYYRIEKGQWAGRIGLKAIKTREPFNYLFDADEHGNLAEDGIVYIGALPSWTVIEDWQKDLKKSGMGQRYPVNKFIIFSYSKEFSNHYGQSDLRSAYRCYSADTKVLTENGWKFFPEVGKQEKVATLNSNTGKLEYHCPINQYEYDYKGQMFYQGGKVIDLLVTPNHKLWVSPAQTEWKGFKFIEAGFAPVRVRYKRDADWDGKEEEYFILPELRVLQKVSNHTGKDLGSRENVFPEKRIKMDDWLSFLGIFLAEGCAWRRKDGNRQAIIAITQKERKNVDIIINWVKKCGFNYYEHRPCKNRNVWNIEITSVQLYEYMKQFGKAHCKFIPKEIKSLSKRQLKILYNAMAFGDGTRDGSAYFTVSDKLADDVQEIILKMGYASSRRQQKNILDGRTHYIWRISLHKQAISRSYVNQNEDNRKWIDYDGKVYCMEVPNHLLYVQRNGKSCWCGNSWFSKEILIRFMNIYGERFGMPTHVGKVPPGTPKPDRDDLKKVLDQVQSKYAIVIPNDITIELLQAGSGGWEGYRSAIEMHNKFIARSILVPDLMGYTEMTGGGAYALGKKQFDMFLWIINRGQRDVEESIMGEQVIKRLIDLNWADTENYPKFKFGSITEEGSVAKSQILAMALSTSLVNREEGWVRDYLGLPARDPNIELPPMQVPGAGLPPAIEERLKGLEGKVDEVKGFFTEFNRKLILDFQEKKELKTVKVKPTKFDKKLNYVELKKTLDDYEEESVDSMSAVVKRMRDDMVRFVRRRKIIEDKDAGAINKLQVKYVGDLKRDIEARLVKLYLDSKLNAAKMLQDSGVKLEIVTKFQEVSIPEWEPVPPIDAIDFFKKKVLVKVVKADGTKVLVELASGKILDYYTQKAFYVAGVERDYILKEAKASLLASLRDGDSVDKAMFNLSNVFDKYIERGELDDEGELVTPHRLETIVRTNFSEAYNQGLRDFVDNNDITDFVPYLVYSAILDDRVRIHHAEMSGKIFREDDPAIENLIPAGYQCRCTWIPLTSIEIEDMTAKGEGVEVSTEKDFPPDFPDPGFKSFSENGKDIADVEVDEFIKFDPNSTETIGHYRLVSPASFKKDSMTTWDSWAGIETKGVKFIVGDLRDSGEKAVQAVRFDKSNGWTEDKASGWWDTYRDKFEKTWTQSDWDKTKYTVTYNGLISDPSSFSEAKGYQKAVKMMGGGDVEMVEVVS